MQECHKLAESHRIKPQRDLRLGIIGVGELAGLAGIDTCNLVGYARLRGGAAEPDVQIRAICRRCRSGS